MTFSSSIAHITWSQTRTIRLELEGDSKVRTGAAQAKLHLWPNGTKDVAQRLDALVLALTVEMQFAQGGRCVGRPGGRHAAPVERLVKLLHCRAKEPSLTTG